MEEARKPSSNYQCQRTLSNILLAGILALGVVLLVKLETGTVPSSSITQPGVIEDFDAKMPSIASAGGTESTKQVEQMEKHIRDLKGELEALRVGLEKESATKQVEQLEKHVYDLEGEMGAMRQEVGTLRKRFWLEALEPVWNFRSKFWLGKTDDVEDKEQLKPHFLANFVDATNVTTYKRRIYIDLGLKDFDSSVCWMMQNYPVKFDTVYGFECDKDMTNVTALKDDITRCLDGMEEGARGYKVGELVQTMKFHHNFVGPDEDEQTDPPTRGLSHFLKDIGIQEDDFVVMKMDVEGLEYKLLERIMEDGSYKLLDEVFVEVHYTDPDMFPYGWDHYPERKSDAQALLTKARDLGMFIHPWP